MPFDVGTSAAAARKAKRAARDALRRKVRSRTRIIRAMVTVTLKHRERGIIPTLLTYEGFFIAHLRGQLCLAGMDWRTADRAAREAVAEAFENMQAKRPTWADGQPASVGLEVKDTHCRWCGVGLRTRQVNFCSSPCHHKWWRAFNKGERCETELS